jgi:predicted nucleic acid-binding protein
VRALPRVGNEAAAAAWVEEAVAGRVRATVPDLVYGEVANALLRYVRGGRIAADDARSAQRLILELPLRVVSLRTLAADALALAQEIGLSAYDAAYVLLSEASGATLVTADRRLAATAERVALLPDDGPPTPE